jgi:hypothetical protein
MPDLPDRQDQLVQLQQFLDRLAVLVEPVELELKD